MSGTAARGESEAERARGEKRAIGSKPCRRIRLATAYLRGELSSGEHQAFEEHIRQCPPCREETLAMGGVIRRLQGAPEHPLSRDLAPEVLRRIPPDEWRRHPLRIFPLRFPIPIASLAAAAVAGVILAAVAHRFLPSARPAAAAAVGSARPRYAAVADGLAWLRSTQEADGSWDAARWGAPREHTVGLTALALLAFHGDRAFDPAAHGRALCRGVDFLRRQQDGEGRIGPACGNQMYNHGMAAVALLKIAGAGQAPVPAETLRRAADYTAAAQTPDGGWGYEPRAANGPNTSVSIWQMQALLLAEAAGRSDLAPKVDRGLAWLRSRVDTAGRMGYTQPSDLPNEGHETLTAAGVLCLFGGRGAEPSSARAAPMIRALQEAVRTEGRTVDYYRWYFVTRALDRAGDRNARRLAGGLRGSLIDRQTKGGELAGSWDVCDRWAAAGGRIYATSMAVLSLE